jgi:hypothetical protein
MSSVLKEFPEAFATRINKILEASNGRRSL